jgi:hypothetical protein
MERPYETRLDASGLNGGEKKPMLWGAYFLERDDDFYE